MNIILDARMLISIGFGLFFTVLMWFGLTKMPGIRHRRLENEYTQRYIDHIKQHRAELIRAVVARNEVIIKLLENTTESTKEFRDAVNHILRKSNESKSPPVSVHLVTPVEYVEYVEVEKQQDDPRNIQDQLHAHLNEPFDCHKR